MNTNLFLTAMNDLVNQMASEYAAELPKYDLRIEYWHISKETGERVVHSVDRWVIDEEDLFDHIKKAKRLYNTTITAESTKVIVERTNYDGDEGRTATYTPKGVA